MGVYLGTTDVNMFGGRPSGGTVINNQDKTVTPSESIQTISADAGYTGLGTVSVGAIDSYYVGSSITKKSAETFNPSTVDRTIASGTYLNGAQTIKGMNLQSKSVSSNGTVTADNGYDALSQVTVDVPTSGGMNMQAWIGRASRTANSYGATSATLTVEVTGTYTVTWTAWRSSSSGTMGTNLHVNNTSGTNQQTFTNTYGQQIQLTNQHYNAGDVLTIYATSGSNSRTINVSNLIIQQTA